MSYFEKRKYGNKQKSNLNYLSDPEWLKGNIPKKESLLNEAGISTKPKKPKRSTLDRVLDAIMVGQYTTQGAIKNMIDGDSKTTALGGIKAGFRAANPFGEGYEKGETSFHDIMEASGIKRPKSKLGKFAYGAADIVGSVALDPLTYATFGTGALLKGGAKAISTTALKNMSKESLTAMLGKKATAKFEQRAAKNGETFFEHMAKNIDKNPTYRKITQNIGIKQDAIGQHGGTTLYNLVKNNPALVQQFMTDPVISSKLDANISAQISKKMTKAIHNQLFAPSKAYKGKSVYDSSPKLQGKISDMSMSILDLTGKHTVDKVPRGVSAFGKQIIKESSLHKVHDLLLAKPKQIIKEQTPQGVKDTLSAIKNWGGKAFISNHESKKAIRAIMDYPNLSKKERLIAIAEHANRVTKNAAIKQELTKASFEMINKIKGDLTPEQQGYVRDLMEADAARVLNNKYIKRNLDQNEVWTWVDKTTGHQVATRDLSEVIKEMKKHVVPGKSIGKVGKELSLTRGRVSDEVHRRLDKVFNIDPNNNLKDLKHEAVNLDHLNEKSILDNYNGGYNVLGMDQKDLNNILRGQFWTTNADKIKYFNSINSSKADQNLFQHIINNGGKIDSKVSDAARALRELLDKSKVEETKRGLLGESRLNYVPYYNMKATDLPKGKKQKIDATKGIEDVSGMFNPNALSRKGAKNEKLADKGPDYEQNVFAATFKRINSSNELVNDYDEIMDVLRSTGRMLRIEDLGNIPSGYTVVAPNGVAKLARKNVLNQIAMDRPPVLNNDVVDAFKNTPDPIYGIDVAKDLFAPMRAFNRNELTKEMVYAKGKDQSYWLVPDEIYKLIEKKSAKDFDEATTQLANIFDKFTTWWKMNATAVNLGFHGRNAMSNQFNNFLDIGWRILDPKVIGATAKLLAGKTDGYVVGKKGIITLEQLKKEINQFGIDSNNFFSTDLGDDMMKQLRGESVAQKIKGSLNPINTQEFVPYKLGRKMGSVVENEARFKNYIANRIKGNSPQVSARQTNKYLFDYSDLTDFEKNTMKRLFPFYTWMRKNIPLQIDELLSRPKPYRGFARVQDAVEDAVPEDQRTDKSLLNNFAKDWWQLPIRNAKDQPMFLNPSMPLMDMSKLDPTTEGLRGFLSQMNPLAKLPLEFGSSKGYDLYFDKELESYAGETKAAPFWADQNVLGKIMGPNVGRGVANTISGAMGGGETINPETGETGNGVSAKWSKFSTYVPSLNNIDKMIKKVQGGDPTEIGTQASALTLGIKPYSFDEESSRMWQLRNRYYELLAQIRKAQDEGAIPKQGQEIPWNN